MGDNAKKEETLAGRMKGYEAVSKTYLEKKVPVIIRLDGKAFHTFTHHFRKPFDEIFAKSMQQTAKHLCENIQGCMFAYTQSDEITLVLCDYRTVDTCGWFNYNVQKMVSTSAAMASVAFNQFFRTNCENYVSNVRELMSVDATLDADEVIVWKQYLSYMKALALMPTFDSRAFNIPKEDAVNEFVWRQQDAVRNSIQMLGQHHFSHKEMQNRNCSEVKEMLVSEKGVNWEELPAKFRHGSAIRKDENGKWFVDEEIPTFSKDWDYIYKLIDFE